MEVAFVRWPLDALTLVNVCPVVLKLNTPLSHFYRTTMSAGITYWAGMSCSHDLSRISRPLQRKLTNGQQLIRAENAIPHISTHMPIILSLLCTISLLGATSTLSLLQDLLRLTTLQLHIAHCLTRVIWTWLLDSLGGLWNLFRGKRWNVLRQRTDAYQYDVDQLFLGTLAFVVGTFLAPTVLVYAALFFFVRFSMTLDRSRWDWQRG